MPGLREISLVSYLLVDREKPAQSSICSITTSNRSSPTSSKVWLFLLLFIFFFFSINYFNNLQELTVKIFLFFFSSEIISSNEHILPGVPSPFITGVMVFWAEGWGGGGFMWPCGCPVSPVVVTGFIWKLNFQTSSTFLCYVWCCAQVAAPLEEIKQNACYAGLINNSQNMK